MINITCDRCGIDMTKDFANDLYDLNKNGNKDRFDGIGWMLAMALVFNYRLNRHFLYCKKCTGINSLGDLCQETLIDFDKLRLYKQWKDS